MMKTKELAALSVFLLFVSIALAASSMPNIHLTNPRGAFKFYLSGSLSDEKPAGVYFGGATFVRSSDGYEWNGAAWQKKVIDELRLHCTGSDTAAAGGVCGLLIEGQRTLLSPQNNYAATDTTGWNKKDADALDRVTDANPPFSNTAFKSSVSGAVKAGQSYITDVSITQDVKYTYSTYIKNDTAGYSHKTRMTAGAVINVFSALWENQTWERHYNVGTASGDSVEWLAAYIYSLTADTYNVYFTLPVIEEGEFASSIITNTGATAVTRAADSLSFQTAGNISAKAGRLKVCAFTEYDYDDIGAQTGDPILFFADTDFKIYFDESADEFVFAAGGQTVSAATTFSKDTEFCLNAVWVNGGKLMLKLDDGAWNYSAAAYSAATLDANMYMGSDATPANHLYGAITELEIR